MEKLLEGIFVLQKRVDTNAESTRVGLSYNEQLFYKQMVHTPTASEPA